uniref:Uncharacterized protein n=1 Tax=Arundo donax TaxID=35708 RepID=A0A0A9ACN8_ARUDO
MSPQIRSRISPSVFSPTRSIHSSIRLTLVE